MAEYVKFLTNVPEIVTFKFGSPKVFENPSKFKPGEIEKKFSYGVVNRGVDKYLSATEFLYDSVLSKLGDLKDRTLEITQVQDPGNLSKKHWSVKENGQVVNTNIPSAEKVTHTFKDIQKDTDVVPEFFAIVSSINDIKKEIEDIKEYIGMNVKSIDIDIPDGL